jgi:hypothetical protein
LTSRERSAVWHVASLVEVAVFLDVGVAGVVWLQVWQRELVDRVNEVLAPSATLLQVVLLDAEAKGRLVRIDEPTLELVEISVVSLHGGGQANARVQL